MDQGLLLNGDGYVIMTVGLPGCGKSTYAKHFVEEAEFTHLERDIFRREYWKEMFPGKPLNWHHWNLAWEAEVKKRYHTQLFQLINDGKKKIILTDSFLKKNSRVKMIELFQLLGYKVEVVAFKTALHTCLQRNRDRIDSIPERAYSSLCEDYVHCMFTKRLLKESESMGYKLQYIDTYEEDMALAETSTI